MKRSPGELNWLHGMALDSKGNIYATDIIGAAGAEVFETELNDHCVRDEDELERIVE